MTEFWVSSGHHLTRRNSIGALLVTDELLLAFLARPEIVPPADACEAELKLYRILKETPQAPVSKAMIKAMKDEDAQENWQFFINFRNLLLNHKTIEAAYMALIKSKAKTPVMFYNQLVHLILRNALDECEDPFVLRAAELFFRPQKASFLDDALMLADEEVIEELNLDNKAQMANSPLTAMLNEVKLDVLTDDTESSYWSRSDANTMILPLGSNPRARDALARVIEHWLHAMLAMKVSVTPQTGIDDPDMKWFIGLESEGTKIGNLLWEGKEIDSTQRARLIAVFKMQFIDKARVKQGYEDAPVWLLLGMDEGNVVRFKPQNLLLSLPLKENQ